MKQKESNLQLAAKLVCIGLPLATLIGLITGLVVNEGAVAPALAFPPFLWSFAFWPLIPTFLLMAKREGRRH